MRTVNLNSSGTILVLLWDGAGLSEGKISDLYYRSITTSGQELFETNDPGYAVVISSIL